MIPRFWASPHHAEALQELGDDLSLGDGRFPPRNFLLECEVPEPRVARYVARDDWSDASRGDGELLGVINGSHNQYLSAEVQVGVRSQPFLNVGPDCPDTFRLGCRTHEYGGAGGELELVRLEDLRFVADSASAGLDTTRDLLQRVGHANRHDQPIVSRDRSATAALLDAWQDRVDARPLFAAFWEDAHDVADWESSGWANHLRDRMGLAHYNPDLRGSIDVVLFKYRVDRVPENSSGSRLLVRPTVLDSALSEAFYTGEPLSGVGSTVDLIVRDDDPWQEVVHPAIRVDPSHIWSVDLITSGVNLPLADARAHHVLKLAYSSSDEFAELCANVDGDL